MGPARSLLSRRDIRYFQRKGREGIKYREFGAIFLAIVEARHVQFDFNYLYVQKIVQDIIKYCFILSQDDLNFRANIFVKIFGK